MLIVFSIFVLYAAYMLYFIIGLIRLGRQPSVFSTLEPKVSIVIAARNEEDNIGNLLEDLTKQNYPKNKIEVLVANDRSTDNTPKIIEHFQKKHSNFKLINIEERSQSMTPKKHALTVAIKRSKGEIIISTDADCRVPPNWINNIVKQFDANTGVVAGYSKVTVNKNSFFDEYQKIDFLALMAANAGSFGWDLPWTGSGQNIAYRRASFDKIDGFDPVADHISGDDFYLVKAISKIAKARYNPNPDGFVKTQPMQSFNSFFQQRIRWASNTQKLFGGDLFFLLFLFLNLFTNSILLIGLMFQSFWIYLPILYGIKLLCDSILILIGSKLFLTNVNIGVYLLWSIFQPIYTPTLAVLSMLGRYRWKE